MMTLEERNRKAVNYFPLVEKVVNRVPYVNCHSYREDLIAEGQIAVLKSLPKFDPAKGSKLKRFVSSAIRGRVKRARRKYVNPQELLPQGTYERTMKQIYDRSRSEGLSDKFALNYHLNWLESLDSPTNPITGFEMDLVDIARDNSAPQTNTTDEIGKKELLEKALSRLKPLEREIIELRFYKGLTFREIGRHFNITGQGAYQREQQTLNKLKRFLDPVLNCDYS